MDQEERGWSTKLAPWFPVQDTLAHSRHKGGAGRALLHLLLLVMREEGSSGVESYPDWGDLMGYSLRSRTLLIPASLQNVFVAASSLCYPRCSLQDLQDLSHSSQSGLSDSVRGAVDLGCGYCVVVSFVRL